MQRIRTVYEVSGSRDEIDSLAESMVYEQTVEVPPALITDPGIRERIVGVVEGTRELRPGRHQVTATYSAELASGWLDQLLNLVFGNISIFPGVRVVDLELPPGLLGEFPGPTFGVPGLRDLTGVTRRPYLATALKPKGSSEEALAEIAGQFAAGGGDLVKDDHNLVDSDLGKFRRRVELCWNAVRDANDRSGGRTLYFPNLAGPPSRLEEQLDLVVAAGVPGVMLAPFLVGLETTRELIRDRGLFVVAHPSFSGVYYQNRDHGLDHGLALGTLVRLAGCDASVFPNFGGRFTFTVGECRDIATRLRSPLGTLRPGCPMPAGGMALERVADMSSEYGADAIFLVGGSLLSHPAGVEAATRAFMAEILRHR